jgi:diguanylate cyclase (GGDEF)-like protein
MFRVLSCITAQHDFWLVVLAAIVCIATTLTAFRVYSISLNSSGGQRVGWAALTGLSAGAGIWATHFVAMLAYDGGLPVVYEPASTLGSMVVAIVLSALAFMIAIRGQSFHAAAGGGLLGTAIAAMHFLGMSALSVPGSLHWDGQLTGASIVLGATISVAALVVFHRQTGLRAIVSAACILALAICSLHFTAMGAVSLLPDPTVVFAASDFNRAMLAMAIAVVTFIVLLSANAAAFLQNTHTRCETILRDQNVRFQAAVSHLPVGLSMFDAEQRLILCNPAYREIYGLSEDLTRPGARFLDIMVGHVGGQVSGQEGAGGFLNDWIAAYRQRLTRGENFTNIQELTDGRTISMRVGPIPDGGWVDVQEDITERRRHEAKITHMAQHDLLTGLPNRVMLHEHLEHILTRTVGEERAAVLFLDLDHFKEVNDTLGHRVGDGLLKAVADRLRGCVRKDDLVARVGGDEFVIVQRADDPTTEAKALASRIIDTINAPYEIDGHKFVIGVSIGIALAEKGLASSETVLMQADLALYRSKSEGRATYCFFEEDMNTRVRARHLLEQDLRRALANGELQLNYQPLVNLETKLVSGLEALLRWHHPERGLILPAEFIPIAEETGLIISIGEWVLRQACSDAAAWPDHIKVAVNLSPVQFKSPTLVEAVFLAVSASGIAASRLELEVTETALLHDSDATLNMLQRLHDMGVRIVMDDFGTGYSSLGYLRTFPFHKIKIDRSFIATLAEGNSSDSIVQAIGGLGRALKLAITAEGVETQEQLTLVRSGGCTEMQGYLFSRPKSAAEIQMLFPAKEIGEWSCDAA